MTGNNKNNLVSCNRMLHNSTMATHFEGTFQELQNAVKSISENKVQGG